MAAIIEANQIVLDPEKSYEVVNGHPEEKEMPGARHAVVAANLVAELVIFLRTKNLGVVCTEANFKIGEIDVQIFAGEMELVSEDLLPGFRCPIKELFPGI